MRDGSSVEILHLAFMFGIKLYAQSTLDTFGLNFAPKSWGGVGAAWLEFMKKVLLVGGALPNQCKVCVSWASSWNLIEIL